MSRFIALPLLLALACTPELKRDKVVAHAERPVELTVRRHETRVKKPCAETGFYVYRCWLNRTEKRGCVYLDVGTPYDDPANEDPCLRKSDERLVLSPDPVPIDFEVDAEGYRFAWRTDSSWTLGYIWDGRLLINNAARGGSSMYLYQSTMIRGPIISEPETKSTTPIDWRAVKSFDHALPELYFYADEQTQTQLLARLRKVGGEAAVEEMLLDNLDPTTGGWQEAFETLEHDAQKRVAVQVAEGVLDGSADDALDWLDEHPELLPKDFEQQYFERAKAGLYDDDAERTSRWLTRGYKRHRPEVGALACRLLESNALNDLWGMGGGSVPDATAYAIIALTHTRCEAVTRELASMPCTTALRCTHTLNGTDANPSDGAEPQELCDAHDRESLEAAMNEDELAFDNFEPAAKMGALLAQGPLPKAFTLANARRTYRLLRPDAGHGREVVIGSASPCQQDDETLSEFLCKLSPEQTHFVLSRCEVDIDDAKQQVRLRSLEAPDGGLLPPSRP